MINLEIIQEYLNVTIILICLSAGYVLKTTFDIVPNKYIPTILAFLGVIASIGINQSITWETGLIGALSGLASTGMYEMFRNIVEGNKGA